MSEQAILDHLAKNDAVLTGSHFIFTSGNHGTAYIDMRMVAHHASWFAQVGHELANAIQTYNIDLVVGPETLGRNLAQATAEWTDSTEAIWCSMDEVDGVKRASFSPKLKFERLVRGKRIAVVDDLLTTGSSVKAVSELIKSLGGEVVVVAVVVRRSPEVTAEDCGADALEVLANVHGFEVFTPEDCAERGPCSQQVPVVLRPGYGWQWSATHPDYPTA